MKMGHLELFEKVELNQFRMCFDNLSTDHFPTIHATELTDRTKVQLLLNEVKERVGAPTLMVAASLFAKRYSHCIAVPALYAMSKFNKCLKMEIGNIVLVNLNNEDPLWLPKLYLKDQSVYYPNIGENIDWKRDYIKKIFSEHLNTIWNVLAEVGNISKQILWENTALYVYWLYENVLQGESDQQQKNQIDLDFKYLLFEADSSLFGSDNENPLLRFYNAKSNINGIEVRKRKTCCFSYEMAVKGTMCKGCPKKCLSSEYAQ
ncbi:IucA/IucC family C-terminal-domain containing protein [Bacillus sp. Marseille-P3661]|uniref:IucA/IucC family C-terminal-domain containing protein n=1 Tax=Bacillus sp. Marseille-P3661 TaxID=1936234 RepID=UPI0015E16454|nr:IucA/IucC family C-terminal-domain containing protein [Bacillus sp. Marseille-P3661]